MSKNVFDQIGDIRNDIKRSTFDWSKTNNFTTALGRITPVYCEQCPPNTSLRIKPQFGLRFMPMMFPVQTNLKAYLSFYKVPLRTLWKDYKDWVSSPNDQTSTLEPPYIKTNQLSYASDGPFAISGLADYLGVPIVSPIASAAISEDFDNNTGYLSTGTQNGSIYPFFNNTTTWTGAPKISEIDPSEYKVCCVPFSSVFTEDVSGNFRLRLNGLLGNLENLIDAFAIARGNSDYCKYADFAVVSISETSLGKLFVTKQPLLLNGDFVKNGNNSYITFPFSGTFKPAQPGVDTRLYLAFVWCQEFTNVIRAQADSVVFSVLSEEQGSQKPLTTSTTPFYVTGGDNSKRIKLSAYPFRAYEAVYNAYLRNIKNNPFKIDGKVKYNTWLPTDEGGADDTGYNVHYANWASDMFTTAVPSPQQGQAPLVGITTYGKTVALENGHTETQLGVAMVDEDGKKYDVSFESNGEELKDVKYRLLDQNTPVQPVSSLYDLVTSGISINDFRNVNAYQRYLELNQMRGYSYKDIIDGRFDVNVKYCDLLMPEYLGGCTRDIQMNAITQTVETNDTGTYQGALGSQAGNATLFSGSEDISVFCDEESIIIGVMSVVPMPVYTQVLPKHFLYRDRLDSFNPEFDHIGFQPIKYSELCPTLAFSAGAENLEKTFGYQRPWYEYCQKLDTASGLFRTQLRNFLINRVFESMPQLNSAFTTVDPDQVNDVFSVTETTDKILGQIYFDVVAKLPISRVSIPKLE